MAIVHLALPRIVAAAAVAWAGLLVLAPMAPAALAAMTYAAAALVCHQRAERSFHLWGAQLPVCGRCMGIYAGAALVAAAGLAGLWRPRPWLSRAWTRTVVLAGAMPTVVTVAIEWGGLGAVSNTARAAAGLVLGVAAAAVVMAELNWVARNAAVPLARTRS
jgi:uncharacterized membrane protein